MIKLFLIATVAVVAAYAAPQFVSTTAAPITATSAVPIDYYRQYDPYYRNTYDPYYKNTYDPYYKNTYDPYRRFNTNNYFGNDYYNRNYYRNDPYRTNYFGNDYYNKQYTDGYYRNGYYNKNVYKTDPLYYKNYVGGAEANARIVKFDNSVNPDGTYSYAYDTENGISADQQGYPVVGPDNEVGNGATGSFTYTSPEGIQFHTSYVADENGYRTQQSNSLRNGLPVAPEAVAKAVVKPAQK